MDFGDWIGTIIVVYIVCLTIESMFDTWTIYRRIDKDE
jgi:hypothetical protein